MDKWQDYYNSKEPHKVELPDNWQKDLNEFQRMIVLRCIRPDKVGVQNITASKMKCDKISSSEINEKKLNNQ